MMTPKFLIPYVDIAINRKRKICHTARMQIGRWRFNPHKLNRVLINKLDPGNGIGDYIQCSPLVIALKKASPSVEISFLVSGKEDLKIFDMFSYPVSVINLHPSEINFEYLSNFAKTVLRAKDYDLIMHGYGEDQELAQGITKNGGFKNSFGYFSKKSLGSYPFLSMILPSPNAPRPFSYDDNLKGILDVEIEWQAKLDMKHIRKIDGLNDFIMNFDRRYKILGIHPGCKANKKKARWPLENFLHLVRLFKKRFEGLVLVFGGPDEEEDVGRTVAEAGDPTVIAVIGEPLLRVTALINQCHLFVSNDSGLMNISIALGIPSIGICGPTDTYSLKNIYPNAVFIGEKMTCCPCYNESHYLCCIKNPDDSAKCLELITPQEVIEKIEQMIMDNCPKANID